MSLHQTSLGKACSWVEVLRRRARESPDRRIYTFLDEEGREASTLTLGELDRRARSIAARLQEGPDQRTDRPERALLLFPPGLDFVAAFFGCLYAGVVAVPAYPPRSARGLPRLRSIAADSGATRVLTLSKVALRESLGVPGLAGAHWIVTDDDPRDLREGSWREPRLNPGDPAFLQYTSGSTAEPKGVVVTHGNLLHNEEVIRRAFGQSESSVVVGWLPLYHDMGLIGNVLQPLWSGGEAVLMSPLAFLQRPRRWLEAISRYRATTSGGPNFAYDLCLRKVREADREGLDLGSWQVAFSGAEPVRRETLERFAEAFAPCGFRRESFFPCYGLAEATLFVTGGAPEEPFRVYAVDPAALEEHRVAPPAARGAERDLVSCGRSAADPEQRLEIVDPETGAPCPPDRIGEVWIAGPGVAAGYWNRPEETAGSFGARLAPPADAGDRFLRTGDLGFLADGELFVTGRLKDLIILRGRNLYPQDVELTAERSHPALRPGCGAAFGVEREGEERLVVVQEVEGVDAAELAAAAEAIRRAVAEEHEAALDDVVLVRRNTVPKTSSGKIQRRACRAAYLAGALSSLAPRAPLPVERGNAALERLLLEEAAHVARTSPDRIDPAQPLIALGLDSLGAVELQSRLADRLGVRVSLARILEGASLIELAGEIRTLPASTERAAVGSGATALSGEHPLSAGQRALWLAERVAPESAVYNLASAARIRGPLDISRLERAFAGLARRHPALRTTFVPHGDGPRQWIHDRLAPDFRVGPFDPRAEAFRPFDLERGPLLRVRVQSLAPGEHELLLVVHHLVSDFWSLTLLVRELAALYRGEDLDPPRATYLDYVRWQEERLAGPRGEELWEYWRRQLAGELPVLEFPTDRPRPVIQSFVGAARSVRLDGTAPLALASARGATLHMLLAAAFQALLHRYHTRGRSGEVLLGSPAAGRAPGLEDVAGYFVNPLVLRTSFADDPTFAELLARVRSAALAALEHQDFPFPLLVERLRPERDPGRSPLFQAMLVLQRARPALDADPGVDAAGLAAFALGEAGARLDLAGLECESVDLGERRVPFDLLLMAAEADGRIELSLQYVAALFDGGTAQRLLGHLAHLLDAAVAAPAERVSALSLLSEAEQRQLAAWSAGPAIAPGDLCLHEMIAAQAARTPDRPALVCGAERLTYAELDRRAEALAGRLRARGVGPEVRVAVCMERSPGLVVALLAVLKAGGAYVPIDPSYPAERQDFMREDSGAVLLLEGEGLPGPGSPAARRPLPGNLAYVIYTSGSTGRPKGVAIEHRSVAALARWARQAFTDEELSGVLASTSVCFDVSVFELFVPLCWGGTMVLVGNALALPETEGVRLATTVPSAMAELLRTGGVPASVGTIGFGGEPVTREMARAVYRGSAARRVLNLYGPSEDTTYSTVAAIADGDEEEPSIGRPIAGSSVWLMDPWLRPVPPGLPGEVCLGGEGLARGYLGRPGLTAERFIPDPFGPAGGRLYRTGDLARFQPGGELRFLGRIDHQVKIRGFRVETGEVEEALCALPGVREAVVVTAADSAGGRRLAAFVTGETSRMLDPVALRDALRRTLPEFMLPAVAVLEALPLTPNGKVDRRALARLGPGGGEREEGAQTLDPTGEILAGIWAEVLAVDRVGAHDDFFALGGHSLLAVRAQSLIRERLRAEVPLGAFFHSPTVARLRRCLTPLRDSRPPLPPRPEGRTRFPLSFAQERLWFLYRLAPESAAYHLAGVARLAGPLDVEALRRAWAAVVRRQEILRTRLREQDGRPVLEVTGEVPELPLADLTEDEGIAFARRPFDLEKAPPFRAALTRLGPESHVLRLVLHHVAADEGSLDVLLHDLAAAYEGTALAGLPFQYADFAAWQRGWLRGEELEGRLAWWEERLAGLARLELPADRPRPAAWSGRGATVTARPGAAGELAGLARREGSTLFMALFAAFGALLGRYGGQEDVAVGSPVSGRDRRELEGLAGLFVNTLVLRCDLSGEPGFRELLRRVRGVTVEAQEHADLPFDLLVDRLRPERGLDRNPLFDVTFAFHRPPASRRAGEVTIAVAPVPTGTAKFDLSLFAVETEDGLELSLEHATDLFETATAGRMLRHLSSLIAGAAAEPDRPVWELPILDPAELRQLLVDWGARPEPGDGGREGLVHELFVEQARRAPERLAVEDGPLSLSYGELDRRAGGWARRLAGLGVGPEVPVALWLDRSASFVVAALAVLRAGGAYVPVDPESPRARLLELLARAGIRHLVTDSRRSAGLGFGGEVLTVDGAVPEGTAPAVRVDGRNLAYAIFTSGSTGTPKAVAVEHAALANLARWHRREYAVTPDDRAPQVAGLGFDAAVWEIWPYLAAGASLHVPDERTRAAPAALVDWMAARGVTLAFLPTPLAELAVARPRPAGLSLRALLTGGDRLHRAPDAAWNLVNHYGPTEGTVVATSAPVAGEEGAPPIGRPIGNVRTFVVDARLRPAPAGVPGELLLGGAGLARGYLGRPDLTAERFVPDPLGGEPGARAYRTGDRVRYRQDGQLEFLGRLDQQIKVQGYRIEPAEVEAALGGHPQVLECAVRTWDGGSLAAYVVPRPGASPEAGELREALRGRLPPWMVPASFVFLDSLPLTPNGKVDRRALPGPERAAAGFAPPRDAVERGLAEIWAEVLGAGAVGIHDDFFELGGRSLLAIEILARARNAFGVELPPRTLFESPTVAELAAAVRAVRMAGADAGPPLVRAGRTAVPASFAQRRLWFLDRLEPGSPLYNLPARVRLQGPLDPARLRRSLASIVERHEAARTTFAARDGEPVQVIHPPYAPELPQVDLAGLADPMREVERASLLDALLPFDLERGPLLRAVLLCLDPEDHVLFLTVHHIIWDGWSLNVFVRELSAFYRGAPAPPELAVQYSDYSEWQRQRLQGEKLERHLAYWRERLAGAPAALDLPTDRPRPPFPTWHGASRRLEIDPATTAAVRALARRDGASVFMTLLAGFTAVLARCARQLDVTVGVPTANRERTELKPLLGFFANNLVLRVDVAADATFHELLARVREVTLGAYSHQEVPFEKLVEALRPERLVGQNPLYQVAFALEDSVRPALDLPGVTATPLTADSGTAKYDLGLYMEDRDGRITGLLEYNPDLFEPATAARLLARFAALLAAAAADPGRPFLELPLLDGAERHWLLYEMNDTDREPEWSPYVHRWFERQAAARPDAPAVSQAGSARTLTYGELDRRANQLAHRLRALGVGPEVRVAVAVERSPELIVALFGILKAGGTYVPLDPAYPADRLAFMLWDCQAPVLLTQPHLAGSLPETQAVLLPLDPEWRELAGERTDAPQPDLLPANLAYMIYTSGSTGRPKGTMIRHDSLASYTETASRVYGIGPADRVLQFCSISFDISIEEIVPCLSLGGELVLRNDAMLESVAIFLDTCRARGITLLSLPTAYWHEITARLDAEEAAAGAASAELPPSLRLVIAAGERALPERLVAWRRHAPVRPKLMNTFGLTESTIISTACDLTATRLEGLREVPIGRAIADSTIYLLDRHLEPVPAGVPGEVFLGGRLLARGYFGRPELTADRFQPHPHPSTPGERVYRTGDLARVLWDGDMEFLGRGDHQVKLRGYRIELGEVETALLRLPQVDAAVVLAPEEPGGQKRLIAWVVPAPGASPTSAELRTALREGLPDYMLPSAMVFLEELPLTPNGKLDRAALPRPEAAGGEVREIYVAPRDEAERIIAGIWKEALGLDRVGIYDNFFDLGGHSLLLIQVHERLKRELAADLPMVELFRYPTVDALARYLSGPAPVPAPAPARRARGEARDRRIAVVGMAGRFPGAPDVEALWRVLVEGRETLTVFTEEELRAAGVSRELLADPAYVRSRGLIDQPDRFDAPFFGLTPREAEVMDPQHRLLLEASWQALEHAGHDPRRDPGRTGVFAGAGSNTYLLFNLARNREVVDSVGIYQAMLGSDGDFLATRVAYKLGLRGPALTVQTACSTSLVAVHLACRSLLDDECDMALAGGVRISVPQRAGYLHQPGGIFSPDGHCRPFDAAAQGTLDGDGVAMVVLKRLDDALADGDHVHAVILGSAINNDGAAKIGYTAPSAEGQAEVIAAAQALAGVAPASIGFVEAHGTATPLGDPIEVSALRQVFAGGPAGSCALGSVKSNFGHLDAAAGVASLIKAVLALERREIPPTAGFERPNPALGLEESPFFVNSRPVAWPASAGPRRAGVSSFGIGGTNAHVVLEEAPGGPQPGPSRPHQLLLLSAATEPALEAATVNLVERLRLPRLPETDLADAAYTLQAGRRRLSHRRMVVCADAGDAAAALSALDPRRVLTRVEESEDRPVIFLFPGQGAQYPGMAEALYRSEPAFRDPLDRCAGVLRTEGIDLLAALYPSSRGPEAAERLRQTAMAQVALFAVEYALARLWMEWGVTPAAMIGHSVGEYVAACLAGVFSLEDAVRLVAARGRLMQRLPPGAMLSVPLPPEELLPLLPAGVELAAVNGPSLCVAAGPAEAVAALAGALESRGAGGRLLQTSHAFHSAMMEPALAPFAAAFAGLRLEAPTLPFVSNLTGTWITADEATGPGYWERHLRRTVRFAAGLETLFERGDAVLLEVGPGRALSSLARRHPARPGGQTVLSSLPAAPEAGEDDLPVLLRALGQLWLSGVPVDWRGFQAHETRRRVALPTYPFERRRYWVEPQEDAGTLVPESRDRAWAPLWRQAFPPPPPSPEDGVEGGPWLVLLDETGLGQRLVKLVEAQGHRVLAARPPYDYAALLDRLGEPPRRIVHLGNVGAGGSEESAFGSLLELARALGERGLGTGGDGVQRRIDVVSSGLQGVESADETDPVKALLLGIVLTLPLELPGFACRSVDVNRSVPAERLLAELEGETDEAEGPVVALRGAARWVQAFEPVHLGEAGPPPLRARGTYLITGGSGGVGMEVARFLARTVQARLVLVSRSAPAPGRLDELEALGAEVLAVAADVTRREEMRGALEAARARFGPLHGVLHAAGLPGSGVLQLTNAGSAAGVLAPKVRGTLILDELLAEGKDPELDFLLLFSSLSAVLGGPGQADYAAANAFLGAFARSRALAGGPRVLSIDWDAWRGVGMAAPRAGRPAAPSPEPAGETRHLAHPLLLRRTTAGPEEVFLSRFKPGESWVLDEHRLGGHPIVPGTTYLEMAGAAFGEVTGNRNAFELRDVLFVAPLRVGDGESAAVRTVLRPEGGAYRFSVASDGQEHALGTVQPLHAIPATVDLGGLQSAAHTRTVLGEEYREDLRTAGLGPRWESLRQVWLGDGYALGYLELARELDGDTGLYHLHPALLDIATSFGESYVPKGEGHYLPLSYRRLLAYGPLPKRAWSYVRFGAAPAGETLAFDVSILDEKGTERVRIEEFVLKRIDVAQTIRARSQPREMPAAPDPAEGLETAEALELLRRILAGPRLPQVAVSRVPLPRAIAAQRRLARDLAEGKPAGGLAPGHARPDVATAYVAPRDETEAKLAGMWQEILGIEPVGIFDEFFDLGGHSLLAMQVISRVRAAFGVELPLRALFEAPTIAALALRLQEDRSRGAAARPPLVPTDRDQGPLSFAQERLWFLERLEPGSAAYHLPTAMRITGDLDRRALAHTLGEIIRRHAALRTAITGDEPPLQTVVAGVPLPLVTADLLALSEAARGPEAGRLLAAELRRSFDLGRAPLLRALLLRLGETEWLLVLVIHHLVGDGWSTAVLIRETVALYAAFRQGLPSPLPELPVQYLDHAIWQRGWLQGEALQEQLGWWRRELEGAPALLELAADRPRPALRDRRGAVADISLPEELAVALGALARREGATLFMVLMTGFQTLLHRTGGQDEVLVGTTVASRNQVEIEGLIGFFANTLVLRGRLGPEADGEAPTFRSLLEQARTRALGAFAHQDLPFERLVEELSLERSLSHSPIFQVAMTLQNAPADRLELPGAVLTPLPIDGGGVKFDLTLDWMEREGRLVGDLEYATDLFDPATAIRLLGQLRTLLEAAAAEPAARLTDLPLLGAAERHQAMVEWNDTALRPGGEATLHGLIAARAARAPEAVAVTFEGETLTYAELEERAGFLARRLRGLGVRPEVRVGLCAERSLDLVVGLLGILEAGGAYVPLDPGYPDARLAVLLEDAGAEVLLVQGGLAERLRSLAGPAARLVELEAAPGNHPPLASPGAAPGNAAYVIFTSGSTGRPKGAINTHRAIVNRLLWMQGAYGLTPDDRVLQKTPFSFDVSVWEFFWPLLTGARLVVARPGAHQDAAELVRTVAREGITHLHFVPSMLRAFLEEPDLERCAASWRLRRVIASGEALPPDLARDFHARLGVPFGVELHNLYGPTEAAVDVTFHACRPGEERVPIGRPVDNVYLRLLDRDGGLAPLGVAGELCLGGPQLARGYVGRPDLTAERFVPDGLGEPGARLYRTGDLARLLPDGEIEYLGRIDHQIKLRGFRIELGEIEAALSNHPEVREAVAMALPEPAGGLRLIGCVSPRGAVHPRLPEALGKHLRRTLPDYMVPSAWVVLKAFPLTPNGKVDRRALEPLARTASGESAAPAGAAAAPAGLMEELVAAVWSELLGVSSVGRGDDFFALGGHSLLATRAVSRLRRAIGAEVPLRLLFEAPTVARLARALEAQRRRAAPDAEPILPLPRDESAGGLPLSFAQERIWFLDRLMPRSPLYNIPAVLQAEGNLDTAAFAAAVRSLAARHEILRTTYGTEAGLPVQRIAGGIQLSVPEIDLRGLPPKAREAEARGLAGKEARRPFDLAAGPLLRVSLLRVAEDERLVLATFHHIVADGWSLDVFLRDLAAFYRGEAPPTLPVQYADYAAWQRRRLSGDFLQTELAHWRQTLAGTPWVLELPADRPRPPVLTYRGARELFRLSVETAAGTAALGRRHEATPFMVLLALFEVLLARLTGREELIVGTPMANRDRIETEGLIGFFMNTLALRVSLQGEPGLAALLPRVREAALAAYAHQELPFEKLVEELKPARDLAHTPLVQVMFTLLAAGTPVALPGVELAPTLDDASETGTARFDLSLNLSDGADGLAGALEYNLDLFDPATVRRFAGAYAALLAAALADPGRPFWELPLLTPEEHAQMLGEWNDTQEPLPGETAVHRWIEEQARHQPNAVAVVQGERRLTYAELDARAGVLARRLAARGLAPERCVALLVERSVETVVALLAVMKTGGAWLPLDPGHPRERLARILEDAGNPLVLADGDLLGLDEEAETGNGAPLPAPFLDPDGLAYVIFTSGSTGRPKGVQVVRRGLANFLASMRRRPGLAAGDVLVAVTTLAFDISGLELLLPLTVGARVVVAGGETAADGTRLAALLAEHGATAMQATPATWRLLLESAWEAPPGFKVLCGGEALPGELATRLGAHGAEVWNLYGPTETTIWSTVEAVDPARAAQRAVVPLGRPIANTRIHLAGRGLEPVPAGVPGELLIGGAGLARGYLGRPDLTAERFVPDPLGAPGERLYRTGDLARRLPDGRLEFLGRLDHQVKIRGYRIELGEIEAALAEHPAVRYAVVVDRPGPAGERRLVAYAETAEGVDGTLALDQVRAFLRDRLPDYMLPTGFVTMDRLPLNPSGKVDRRALPDFSPERPELAVGYIAPREGREALLATLWSEILGVERVGIHDNFFDLGGHSLLLMRLQGRLAAETGLDLPVLELFEHPTVAALARRLRELAGPVDGAADGAAGMDDRAEELRHGKERRARRRRASEVEV